MNAPILESKRLVLNPLHRGYASAKYVNWLNDREVNRYLESGGDYTIEKLKNYLIEQEKKQILFWAVQIKDSEEHIGNLKIDPVDQIEKSGEYGILMGEKSQWGKGYAREASLLVIDFCFRTLDFAKITLGVKQDNTAAIKLYQNLGFQIVKRDSENKSLRMELLNEEG